MTPEKYAKCLDSILGFLSGSRPDFFKVKPDRVLGFDEQGAKIDELTFDSVSDLKDVVPSVQRVLEQYRGRISDQAIGMNND